MSDKSLVKRIYNCIGPKVELDKKERTFEIVKHGYFFENLTGAYYILKGYRQVKS